MFRFSRHIFSLVCTVLALSGFLAAAGPVHAGIRAEIELGYQDYQTERPGEKEGVHSFRQRYSLLYDTSGVLFGASRNGAYNASLGYEWASIDTQVRDGRDTSASSGKILYLGEVRLSPQDLPVYFRAYSYDLSRMEFLDSAIIGGSKPVIEPRIYTDLFGAQSMTTGAMFFFGEMAPTRARESELARQLPGLAVQYEELLQKDIVGVFPVHARTRTLSFLMSKKDNWLQYRLSSFKDFLHPDYSFDEEQYILGTVDKYLDRRWIDLTNWIKISADASYLKHVENSTVPSQELYLVNLFGLFTRDGWQAKSLNSYSRSLEVGRLKEITRVPFYVNAWGSRIDWQSRVEYDAEKEIYPNNLNIRRSDSIASLRATTYKDSAFTFSPGLLVERVERGPERSLNTELILETTSTRRFSSSLSLAAGYDFKGARDERDGETFVVQSIYGRGVARVRDNVSIEFLEEASFATGKKNNLASPTSFFLPLYHPVNSNGTSGYTRLESTAKVTWNVTSRLSMVAAVSEEYVDVAGNSVNGFPLSATISDPVSRQTILRYGLSYVGANLSARTDLSYTDKSGGTDEEKKLEGVGQLTYNLSRSASAGVRYRYIREERPTSPTTEFADVRQTLLYTYYAGSGRRSRLLELSEELSYVSSGRTGATISDTSLLLRAVYYPLARLYIASSVRYSLYTPGHGTEVAGSGEVGVNYQKLQASASYSYGRREGPDTRKDQRIEATVRKQF